MIREIYVYQKRKSKDKKKKKLEYQKISEQNRVRTREGDEYWQGKQREKFGTKIKNGKI